VVGGHVLKSSREVQPGKYFKSEGVLTGTDDDTTKPQRERVIREFDAVLGEIKVAAERLKLIAGLQKFFSQDPT
jgi:hypothetical protein